MRFSYNVSSRILAKESVGPTKNADFFLKPQILIFLEAGSVCDYVRTQNNATQRSQAYWKRILCKVVDFKIC